MREHWDPSCCRILPGGADLAKSPPPRPGRAQPRVVANHTGEATGGRGSLNSLLPSRGPGTFVTFCCLAVCCLYLHHHSGIVSGQSAEFFDLASAPPQRGLEAGRIARRKVGRAIAQLIEYRRGANWWTR